MRLETLRKRALQRFTSPPGILYALSRHWALITGLAAFGTVVMAAKVSTDSPFYEAKATLALNTGQSIVVGQASSTDDRDSERQRISRVALFSSDTVLRKLVQSLKAPNLLLQDENPEEPSYGPFRRFVSQAKRRIKDFLFYLEHPVMQDFGEEHEIQRAVAAFRHRSEVAPNPSRGTVLISVYGTNRELLLKELDQWIEAYRARLLELSRETRDYFLESRMRHWREMETNAQRELEEYRRDNPDLSKAAQDLLLQETLRLQMRREALERRMEGGGLLYLEARADASAPDDPEVEDLISQKRQLEADRRRLLSQFPPESDVVRSNGENIRLVEDKLREVLGSESVVADEPKLAEQVAKLTISINEAMRQQNALASRLDVLQNLEEEHRLAQRTRMSYGVMISEELDRRESTKLVEAQVIEKPQVAWLPYETYPYRQIIYGGLAGLLAGCVLALIFELFRSTIRFRSDVEAEFPVPVIGVIPLR